MALVITPVSRVAPSPNGGLRGEVVKVFSLAADASKPAGGYVIAATALGLSAIDFALADTPNILYFLKAPIATDAASFTVQAYANTISATGVATQAGSAIGASVTDVSTQPIRLLVVGR